MGGSGEMVLHGPQDKTNNVTYTCSNLLKEGRTYYILNMSDRATFNNGFRYIEAIS